MNALPAPTELQLDALREVANVGVGQAACALSRLLGGRRVGLSVPRAVVLPLADVSSLLGGAEAPLVAVTLEMGGGLTGHLLMAMAESHARQLAGALLGGGTAAQMGLAEQGALAEVANILGSACLNGISQLISLRLLPSPPTLAVDVAREVVRRALAADVAGQARAVVMEARFLIEGGMGVEGQLLLIPDAASLQRLLARLGV